jgi:hypothetical protein
MNPQLIMLALGGGAILWWLSQEKKTPATPITVAPGAPATPPQAPAYTPPAAAPPPVQEPPATPPAAPPPGITIAEAFAKMVEAEKQDSTLYQISGTPFATFSQHNWYLNSVTGNTNPLPAYFDVAGADDPNTPMSTEVYKVLITPWLKANRGMSGLGQLRLWPGYVGPGGWRA